MRRRYNVGGEERSKRLELDPTPRELIRREEERARLLEEAAGMERLAAALKRYEAEKPKKKSNLTTESGVKRYIDEVIWDSDEGASKRQFTELLKKIGDAYSDLGPYISSDIETGVVDAIDDIAGVIYQEFGEKIQFPEDLAEAVCSIDDQAPSATGELALYLASLIYDRDKTRRTPTYGSHGYAGVVRAVVDAAETYFRVIADQQAAMSWSMTDDNDLWIEATFGNSRAVNGELSESVAGSDYERTSGGGAVPADEQEVMVENIVDYLEIMTPHGPYKPPLDAAQAFLSAFFGELQSISVSGSTLHWKKEDRPTIKGKLPRDLADKTILRHVDLDGYRLVTWDAGWHGHDAQRKKIGYRFMAPLKNKKRTVIFEGDDFSMPAYRTSRDRAESDNTLANLMGFLTLKPGDTDSDYFDNYTKKQMEFAEGDAEQLSMWGMEEGDGRPTFVDVVDE